jgi:hypothetical protein
LGTLSSSSKTSEKNTRIGARFARSADFLGDKGIRVHYQYAPNDGMSRKGVCVARVVDKKLYAIKLEGVSSHYFDAALPEFDQMVASARLDP